MGRIQRMLALGVPRMSVKIRIPRYLHDKTNGQSLVGVEGCTVRECIEALIQQHPGLKGEILDDQGAVLLKWTIYINDKSAPAYDELTQPLGDGDTVMLLPVVPGG